MSEQTGIPAPAVFRAGGEDVRLLRMAALLGLQNAVRTVPADALNYTIVNETAQAVPYTSAFMWDFRKQRLTAASGTEKAESGSPMLIWASRFMHRMGRLTHNHIKKKREDALLPVIVNRDEPAAFLSGDLISEWKEHLPEHSYGLWIPFTDTRRGRFSNIRPALLGGMLLIRDTAFNEWETEAAFLLSGAFSQSIVLSGIPRLTPQRPRIGAGVFTFVALCLLYPLLFLPVREGVLAPAEVVAEAPRYVRAVQQGIVSQLLVKPGEAVVKGQPVALLDDSEMNAREAAARQASLAAEAELIQASQESVLDVKARGKLPVLRAKVDETAAELRLARLKLNKTHLYAPTDGIAVFDDPAEIIGKPVETGERIMLVSPAVSSRIEIKLPSSDDLPSLTEGGTAVFHPNGAPLDSRAANVDYIAYFASAAPDGTSYRILRADFSGEQVRLGTRGTARVYAADRPFILWVLRRPIASVRQWLGL